jgi:hypothetical protein
VVAAIAEQSTDPPGRMTVVNCKPSSGSNVVRRSLTNEANSSLFLKDTLVIFLRKPVFFMYLPPPCGCIP